MFVSWKRRQLFICTCILTMEWNLMARSDNCVNMHVQLIQWKSLIFYFGKSKGNQSGERTNDAWHVCSNPKNPFICPVLSMAKYLFCNPDILPLIQNCFREAINMSDFSKYYIKSSTTMETNFNYLV